jgi:hypothetical protein
MRLLTAASGRSVDDVQPVYLNRNDGYLRIPAGWSRRLADIADRFTHLARITLR